MRSELEYAISGIEIVGCVNDIHNLPFTNYVGSAKTRTTH